MISYARQFLGNPYVWGGESLTEGTDCSGFTQQIYAAFGISLPRCSYEQAEAGTKIAVEDALPGDLVFYARDGVVYHVMMYIGNGQVIHASSSTTGIIESNLNYDKVCWACRFITDDSTSSTQASTLVAIGKKAVEGDTGAQMQIIESLATAATRAYEQYGLLRSVMIAQVIQESGWLSFSSQTNGGIQPSDNNILNISEDIGDDTWLSPWTGIAALRSMPVSDGFQTVYEDVSVRTYEDMEACLADEAAYLVGNNLALKGEKNVDTVIDTALKDYTDDPGYRKAIKDIIEKYSLTRYDSIAITGTSAKDDSSYTQEELELIWAIVAQEDDQSYEGALAVISSAMNRADANYGGYGTTALAQLTADGQYCYSPKVSDPSLWQRRLGGNVPDDVKKAVEDCLTKGIRNNTYLNFRSSNRTGDYIQIGANWYF
jgi:flagellum-specific peptidoglycan hydrolase FlgJ